MRAATLEFSPSALGGPARLAQSGSVGAVAGAMVEVAVEAVVDVSADAAVDDPTQAQVNLEAASFKLFYADNHEKLTRALSLYFGDADLGAEAADEAFVRAYERWDEVAEHPNPYGWVYVVGTNRAKSVLRRRVVAREKQQLAQSQQQASSRADVGAGEPDLDTKAAVARLRPAWRKVVVARFYLQMSTEETAEALGVKSGTVKSRLSRALDQLRVELSDSQEL